MFNRKSIYALNKKDPNAIVYMDADGNLIRLTRDDFASEEEFLHWKKLSDADYHGEEKADHLYYDGTLSLEGLSEEALSIMSAEEDFITKAISSDRSALLTILLNGIDNQLTASQKRRVKLYYFDGLSEKQIAEIEKVSQQGVSDCLRTARKKLEKFLKKHLV